jgi:transposase, IS6 family
MTKPLHRSQNSEIGRLVWDAVYALQSNGLGLRSAIAELKSSGELGRRCRCRPSPYLNNIVEQDHRFVKKRIAASLWFLSVEGKLLTVAGYEAMHAIRKRQIRWLSKGDVVGQVQFIQRILGIAA